MAQHWKMQGGDNGDYVARVLSGRAEHCAFCAALASLGFIHQYDAPPEFWKFHDGCGCVMVSAPDPNTTIEGVDYSKYREAYEACKVEGDLKATLANMRRAYPDLFRDAVQLKRIEDWGFAHYKVTNADLEHILNGGLNHKGLQVGGHRYGASINGKTWFPKDWTDERIGEAVRLAFAEPQWTDKDGDRITIRRFVDGVLVEGSYYGEHGGYVFRAAFPRNGVGVYKNTSEGLKQKPLDPSAVDLKTH